ncbi:MAG TPA: class I SAM-dependent methyltransferase [Nocardioidaceae bacterium]|nr:class I SAM-dependent methyltransferase [Nocardioidaceae bacterium]
MAQDQSGETRWARVTGGSGGREYAARFAALAAQGRDVHGEAAFCASLVPPGSSVLDAGCGTGRVAIRLAELGYVCVGVDLDDSMLAVARETAPGLTWRRQDLVTLDVTRDGARERFDLVVLAGNVVPLLAEGALEQTVLRCAAHLSADGLLVAGFGLGPEHLPPGCPVTPLTDYDAACVTAGLALSERFATWDGQVFTDADGYAVSVHRHRSM